MSFGQHSRKVIKFSSEKKGISRFVGGMKMGGWNVRRAVNGKYCIKREVQVTKK